MQPCGVAITEKGKQASARPSSCSRCLVRLRPVTLAWDV